MNVTGKQDKSLALFCKKMRAARRGENGKGTINDNRIQALDELGFDCTRNLDYILLNGYTILYR